MLSISRLMAIPMINVWWKVTFHFIHPCINVKEPFPELLNADFQEKYSTNTCQIIVWRTFPLHSITNMCICKIVPVWNGWGWKVIYSVVVILYNNVKEFNLNSYMLGLHEQWLAPPPPTPHPFLPLFVTLQNPNNIICMID